MVKALSFKGDPKPKKRKRTEPNSSGTKDDPSNTTDLVSAHSSIPEDDTTWVSADSVTDISGPVIFVLPTKPPTCLASDAIGKVFASPIENMVEDEPSTAEPHDVRQVWIANRVAGSNSFSFKGHHGKYLSVDKFGIPTATRDAVSAEESFTCLATGSPELEDPTPNPADTIKHEPDNNDDDSTKPTLSNPAQPSTFHLLTTRKTLFSISDPSTKESTSTSTSTTNETQTTPTPQIRADVPHTSHTNPSTHVRIRMQARFKPRLAAAKIESTRAKISRSQLEAEVGRRLEDSEVKTLKRARREGTYYEAMLEVKVKGKHDKYA